jgi:signal transduction histidine kinase
MISKSQTVVMLRWVLIIASSYLLILDAATPRVYPGVALLIAVALTSNLVIARMPEPWLETRIFDFGVVLFDAGWVTLGLAWAPNVSEDLFLLYFLVIFIAAVGESLQMIVGSAVVISVVYGATLSLHAGGGLRLTTTELMRVPFLFVVALFYGYFVTELRGRRSETAEARLREQAKSELLAAVSHDLRGPLGNAENFLVLMLDAQADGQAPDRSLLLRAQVNVRRVSSLVSNLLEAACIEAGQVHFQMTPVQLNEVVSDVLNLEGSAAVLKETTLKRDINPEVPAALLDHLQVSRIVTNLVNNAIKYTDVGGTVEVRTGYDAESVYIAVRDSGPGMTEAQCHELFAPYRRVQLHGYTPGTGLGLYIVKRLTEGQGGQIHVASTVGVGSTFVVSFPRARVLNGAPPRLSTRQNTALQSSPQLGPAHTHVRAA